MLDHAGSPDHPLTRVIDQLAHLLPAQGPISIFIHHNTLHAFEHLLFEEAVERAGERLGREPFLAESRYREKLASGRILARDVEALLVEQLGHRGAGDVAGVGSRLDLWRAVVLHGIPAATGRELSWVLEETEALSRFRTDVPANARSALAALREVDDRVGDERRAVRRLWNACLEAAGRADQSPVSVAETPVRHRDWLLAVHGLDTDAWIHPPLIRFLAGYLDQGLAHWSMPERSRGIHGCFLEIYRTSLAAQCGHWARTLPQLVAEDYAAGRNALGSIANSLAQLGVADQEYADYLSAERLASCVRSKSGPTACRHGTSRSHCGDTSRSACCSSARRSTRPPDNSPSTDRRRTCAPGCGAGSPAHRLQRRSSARGRSFMSRSSVASMPQSWNSGPPGT